LNNEVLTAIAERRSIRQYKPEQISGDQLAALLKAAQEAPSARNSQPWHFSVVQDQSIIAKVNDAAVSKLAEQGGFYATVKDIFYSAPTVIFISADKDATPWASLDCGIAVQTIALAAQSLGLGTVILGLPMVAWETESADELSKLLKFPDKHTFAVAIAVGYAAASKPAHPIDPGKVDII